MDPTKAPSPPPETKLHFLDYWRIIRIRKTVILAVFLLVVFTATFVTFFLPEWYSSFTRIKVERDASDIQFLNGPNYTSYDPYFIQTEFEVLQSELILGKTLDELNTNGMPNLNLSMEWGKKFNNGEPLTRPEVIKILKRSIDPRPVRNTSLIDVRVTCDRPDHAAQIANALARAYKQHRLEEKLRMTTGGIVTLEERFREHDEKVVTQQRLVDKLRLDLNISDAVATGDMPTMLMSAEALRRVEALRIESRYELVRQETILRRLRALQTNSTPIAAAHAIQSAALDTVLAESLQQLNLAEQGLLIAQKDFGPEHPNVIKSISQVAEIKQNVAQRVTGFLEGLDTKVAALREGLEKIEEEKKKAEATDIANASSSRPYFEAKRRLEDLQRFGQLLLLKIASEKIEKELPKTGMVTVIETAIPNPNAVRPNKPLNIALGIIIGLVVGVGLAFFIEYLDTSVKTIDDVERALQAPVLGVIPQNVTAMTDESIESPHAEAYRVLRTNILFSRKNESMNAMAVVSAGAGEGKSTTVFNLASIFAQSGNRVVLVDSDLRRPTLHKILHVTNSIGLTNYLLKQNKLEEVIQTTRVPTLDFLASGKLPSSSLGILSSSQMRELIRDLKSRYDYVFFDSPPIMGVSDASILASAVDMTLQVIQYRRYPQPMNIRAKQLIEKVGGNLVGIVLNNINMSQDESYYYYSGYYHDYYSKNTESDPGKESSRKSGSDKDGDGEKTKLELNKKY